MTNETRNPKFENAMLRTNDDYQLSSFDIHPRRLLTLSQDAKVSVHGLSARKAQALARGTIGGSLKMLCRLGMGGCNVREGPNSISAQLLYSFSGP